PGVDRDRVHGLRVEVGTVVELPGATPPAPDEQALAGADGEQYLGHADHLRGVIPDAFARTRASLHPTTDSHLWIRRRGWSVRCAEPCGAERGGPPVPRAVRRRPAGRARGSRRRGPRRAACRRRGPSRPRAGWRRRRRRPRPGRDGRAGGPAPRAPCPRPAGAPPPATPRPPGPSAGPRPRPAGRPRPG